MGKDEEVKQTDSQEKRKERIDQADKGGKRRMTSVCPYQCDNKTEFGYCKTTVCINPLYNQYQLGSQAPDIIERNSAITYAISCKAREIDGERWIRIRDVRDGLMAVPSLSKYFVEGTKRKMIEIKVEDYCQNCPEFHPGVEAETLYSDGYETERLTTVLCIHQRRCEAIARSLKKCLLAEMKEVVVTDAESD